METSKVYLVHSGDEWENRVEAVFSNEKEARKYQRKYGNWISVFNILDTAQEAEEREIMSLYIHEDEEDED